jgi:hypothetical protein
VGAVCSPKIIALQQSDQSHCGVQAVLGGRRPHVASIGLTKAA